MLIATMRYRCNLVHFGTERLISNNWLTASREHDIQIY